MEVALTVLSRILNPLELVLTLMPVVTLLIWFPVKAALNVCAIWVRVV